MYTKGINAITGALRAAEMRQGCTNHSHYAEILLNELGLPDMYEALKDVFDAQEVEGERVVVRTVPSSADVIRMRDALKKAGGNDEQERPTARNL